MDLTTPRLRLRPLAPAEMQDLLHNDGGIMVLMFNSYVSAYSNKLGHEEHVAANWDDDGMKLTSRWWFA